MQQPIPAADSPVHAVVAARRRQMLVVVDAGVTERSKATTNSKERKMRSKTLTKRQLLGEGISEGLGVGSI